MEKIPHQGLVNIRITGHVHQKLPTGKVNGYLEHSEKKSILLNTTGDSLDECKDKTKELIQEILEAINERQTK